MNYSILLSVKKPNEQNHNLVDQYEKLIRILEGLQKRNTNIRLLAEGTILLPIDSGLQDVADAVKSIKNLPYTYAIVPQDTQWIEAVNKDV